MKLPDEEELVRRCLSFEPDRVGDDWVWAHPRLDWNRVLRVAALQSVLPFLYRPLSRLQESAVQKSVLEEARKCGALVAARNERNGREVGELLVAFRAAAVPLIFLKGIALLHTVYKDSPQLRSCRDIDILVRKTDLGRAHDVMLGLGYRSQHDTAVEIEDKYLMPTYTRPASTEAAGEPDPDSLHITNIRKRSASLPGEPISVEVHFDLVKPRNTPFRVAITELWERARSIRVDNQEMLVLAAEDTVLHGALHMSFHKEFVFRPLRQLRDLGEIASKEPVRWTELCLCARRYHAERPLYYALRLARELLDAPVPEGVLATLRAPLGRWELALFGHLEDSAEFLTYRDPARLFLQTLLMQIPAFEGFGRLRFLSRIVRHPFACNKNAAKQLPSKYYRTRLHPRHALLALQLVVNGLGMLLRVAWKTVWGG